MQTGMKQKVGGDAEFEIKSRLLSHNAQLRQRRHRIARHVMPHNVNAA